MEKWLIGMTSKKKKIDYRGNDSDSLAASLYLLVDAWTLPVKLRYIDPKTALPPHGFCAIIGDGPKARLFGCVSPLKAGKPTAVEQEDTESRTETGILLGPRPISFWGGLFVYSGNGRKGGFL